MLEFIVLEACASGTGAKSSAVFLIDCDATFNDPAHMLVKVKLFLICVLR